MSLKSGTNRSAWFEENARSTWPPVRKARRPHRTNTPGPGSYETTDPSILSGQSTPSSRSFGGKLCKVDRTATGYLAGVKKDSPGPGHYDSRGAVGRQASSKRPTSPTFKFGSSQRDQQLQKSTSKDKGIDQLFIHRTGVRHTTPSPTAYSPVNQNTVPQNKSNVKAPSYTFTRSIVQDTYSSIVPGPGAYSSPVSLGKQISSTNFNSHQTTIGTADREHSKVAVQPGISPGVFKAIRANPGPGTYNTITSSVGDQLLGKNATSGRALFSTADRDRMDEIEKRDPHSTPGPGSYERQPSHGYQPNSMFRTTGRTAFAKSQCAPSPISSPTWDKATLKDMVVVELAGRVSPMDNLDGWAD
jgi:hypothetical protein